MKRLKGRYEQNGEGELKFLVEEQNDLWHLFNLIAPLDVVAAFTSRKVQRESAEGAVAARKKVTRLTISVTKTDYDSEADILRISGKCCEKNEYVNFGQQHTIEIGIESEVSLYKARWDFIAIKYLRQATDVQQVAHTGILLIDAGIAHIYLLTDYLEKQLAKIACPIPRRRVTDSAHQRGLNRFFEQVIVALKEFVSFDKLKCFVVAGPGFVKDDFFAWLFPEAQRRQFDTIVKNKQKFIVAKASSAYKQGINDLLASPHIQKQIGDTKAIEQNAAVATLYKFLHSKPNFTCYGPREVTSAASAGAVKCLLVTDALFKSADNAERRRYVKLAEDVQRSNGSLVLISDLHVSGEQLNKLSGVAAILRFPISTD